jgi:site-specific DNA-methyltransferase (adenine-specific)
MESKPIFCKIICGDSRLVLADFVDKVDLIVTSPPYADARKKHYDSMHPDQFSDWFITFHKPFYAALKPKGSFILNIKDRVVKGVRNHFVWNTINKLEALGWKPVDDYIWNKTNPMPGYWPNRLRDGWEYCFHLAKETKPAMYQNAIKMPIGEWSEKRLVNLNGKSAERHNSENASGFGRDLRKWVGKETVLPSNVVTLPLVGKNYGHPAVFPLGLPTFFIKLFTKENGLVVDPFSGSGSTGIAAINLRRNCVLIDNNKEYCQLAYDRIKKEADLCNVRLTKLGF